MKAFLKIIGSLLVWLVAFGLYSGAYADFTLGTDITIFDGINDSLSTNSWYNSTNEDQEVEPENPTKQKFDLEGFFLKGSELQVVGGFNFKKYGDQHYGFGDIYLDTDGNYGTSNTSSNGVNPVKDNFGYEYVLHLIFPHSGSWNTYSYEVYQLNDDSYNYTASQSSSSPFMYNEGATLKETGNFEYWDNLSKSDVGNLEGGTHYALTGFDLSFLAGRKFTAHATTSCGYDNLMGSGTVPVPVPSTLALLGSGLIGLAGISRKRTRNQA